MYLWVSTIYLWCDGMPEFEHDGVDAEWGYPEEDAGHEDQILQPGLHQYPRHHAQQQHSRHTSNLEILP